MLANVYLHYVPDLRARQWRGRHAVGDVIIARYADDFVLGFQHYGDAVRFPGDLRDCADRFGLALHPDKTRLIEFGRFAASSRRRRGPGKPETFDFLGFTHACSKTRDGKRFTIRRKTIAKRMRAKLHALKADLRHRMHAGIGDTAVWLRSVVRGYMNYYAVPGNLASVCSDFGLSLYGSGFALCADAVTVGVFPGLASDLLPRVGSLVLASCISIHNNASTFCTQGRSRMREIRSYGSVQGAPGNRSSYRDLHRVCLRSVTVGGFRSGKQGELELSPSVPA